MGLEGQGPAVEIGTQLISRLVVPRSHLGVLLVFGDRCCAQLVGVRGTLGHAQAH